MQTTETVSVDNNITVKALIALLQVHDPDRKLEKVSIFTNTAKGPTLIRLHFANGMYTGFLVPVIETVNYSKP